MNWATLRVWMVLVVPVIGLGGVAVLVCRSDGPSEVCDRVLLVAMVAAILSVAVASWNAQWFARRLSALTSVARQMSATGAAGPVPPESDVRDRTLSLGLPLPHDVESPLNGLAAEIERASSAVQQERAAIVSRLSGAEARAAEHAQLLDALAAPLAEAIGEVQLPLHILLENRFGELNENQEEMLQAAGASADRLDLTLRQVRRILDLEHGQIVAHPEAIRPDDLVGPALAMAASRGEAHGVRVTPDLAPAMPSVVGDRYLLEEALAALFGALVDACAEQSTLAIAMVQDGSQVRIDAQYAGEPPSGIGPLLATRLIRSLGGDVVLAAGRATILLATERRPVVRR